MITIKITSNQILIAVWAGLTLVKFKRYEKNYATRITLAVKKLKLTMYDVIYFDSTNEYNQYFVGALKIKLDRHPFKRENYKNLKHQLYFYLLKAINNNQLAIKCEFPNDEFIQEVNQLKQNEYSENNKLEMISRKQIIENIGRDIDLVDLFSYRFFAVLKGIG